ncbi:MAG: Valyl-tRNA synthetase [Parcubacteria group bacterium]|nr:Valyl-tRNA synthetase [Parcubacteria group bacterium]
MEEHFNFQEAQERLARAWQEHNFFTPDFSRVGKTYSTYLVPPNASGPLHIGNALMVAIQDVLARYHRAQGDLTLWIPGTDHGGYETQVTFERELEAKGQSKDDFTRGELKTALTTFVAENHETIVRQIHSLGASVDWTRFRYTLDEDSLEFVSRMFKKMIADALVYRSSYMVNYCPSCVTMLADIETKEQTGNTPLYFIKFALKDENSYVSLATTEPEYLFAVTHILVHPQDTHFASLIGRSLTNPITGQEVLVVESKRKFDPENQEPFLRVFSPSSKKYDFEYAIRYGLPSQNVLDWNGRMVERYPGMEPEQAREQELAYLKEQALIEKVDDAHEQSHYLCKKGHLIRNVIRMTWFLRLDDEKTPLRKKALDALAHDRLTVYPFWRKKGITTWIEKMHDWPIARQNVWGIQIPIWYEVTDPSLFTVWFIDNQKQRRHGNLSVLLNEGVSFEEIEQGLERVYAAEGCSWSLEREPGKQYLPETDTFDTWFSSGAWSAMVFETKSSPEIAKAYPNDVAVIGHDLLRLSISREIMMGVYLTGKIPFKRVFFHQLLQSSDGQKMSKSLGNSISLDTFVEKHGVDVTRMALLSYASEQQDFSFSEERIAQMQDWSNRLWKMGKVCDAIVHASAENASETWDARDLIVTQLQKMQSQLHAEIEAYSLAKAQSIVLSFLDNLEKYATYLISKESTGKDVITFREVFKTYLSLLHPFMPFQTEELQGRLFPAEPMLAAPKTTS